MCKIFKKCNVRTINVNDAKLMPWLILKSCGNVESAHCTCMAGLCECCSHVGALPFYLQFAYLKKTESAKSVTDVSAYWVIPSNKDADPQKYKITMVLPVLKGIEHILMLSRCLSTKSFLRIAFNHDARCDNNSAFISEAAVFLLFVKIGALFVVEKVS